MARLTTKGQVTIPADLRRRLGLMPGMQVDFDIVDGELVVRKRAGAPGRGYRAVAALRGRGTVPKSTDEIMALTRGE